MSKLDPEMLKDQAGLDRRSTMLLAATRDDGIETEKGTEMEDPGMDTIRGSAGIIGSIYRARSMNKSASGQFERRRTWHRRTDTDGNLVQSGMQRHQLYDRPMSASYDLDKHAEESNDQSIPLREHKPAIGFSEDVTSHRYPTQDDARSAIHEREILGEDHHHHAEPSRAIPSQQYSANPLPSQGPTIIIPRKYRDPFGDGSFTPANYTPAEPQSAGLPPSARSTSAAVSLSKKLGNFQSTPDLSLADPRDRQTSKKSLKNLLTPSLSPSTRNFPRRGSKDAEDAEERSHLVHDSLASLDSLEGDESLDNKDDDYDQADFSRQVRYV